jgi:hypothetical protein
MSMYLPNPDLHPTGYEPGEFIEADGAGPPEGEDVPAVFPAVHRQTDRDANEETSP